MSKCKTKISEIAPLYGMSTITFGKLLKRLDVRDDKGLISSWAYEQGIGKNVTTKKYIIQLYNLEKLKSFLKEMENMVPTYNICNEMTDLEMENAVIDLKNGCYN